MPDYLTLAGYLRSNGVTSPAQCEQLITTLLIERPTGTSPPPLTPPLTDADYFDLAGYIRDNGVTSPAQCEQLITTLLLQRPSGAAPPPPPFPTGATHYWALNEATGDPRVDSIAGLNLTPSGSPPQVAGPLDFGVSVNGSASRYLASASEPSLRTGGAWTFNLWSKAIGTLDSTTFLRQGSSNADASKDSNAIIEQGFEFSEIRLSDGSAHTENFITYPDAFFNGAWHMITFRGELNNIDFFVDGIFVSANPNSRAVNATSLPVQLGLSTNPTTTNAQGLADFGTWSRALTDQEITDLYNGGTPLRP